MDSKEKQRLKKFVRQLEVIRGRHTELVSVYVPAGYELVKIIQHLQQEQGTAENIKSKDNRKRVIDSLERMIRHLRLFKATPKNGLAAFAGNVSETESKVDIEIFSIEPPEPINTRLYRCDQTFVLDILKEMLDVKEMYGLIVLDNREGNIGILKGTAITELLTMTSGVPGKIKAGGQSALRFARLREIAAHDFYRRIGDASNKEFYNKPEIKGILIGGPGPTKETFFSGNYLNNEVKKKVLGLKDISYTGDFGLRDLVERSQDLLAEAEVTKEKKLLERLFTALAKEPEKVAYGKEEVQSALEMGAVDMLFLSEDLEDYIIEAFQDMAEKTSTKVEIISVDIQEGQQLKELGGMAAILRFRIS
ncbi:MAG TPA: peptide chain release factor aRF-1 [Candidatus Nanoarchaeia archaeon]|nr:peptide chain release factor aRF-1 [Candidatus Nanoarchaeia archaeon]